MTEGLRLALVKGFDAWAPQVGATLSRVSGLSFHRHTAPTPPFVGFMDASLSLVVSGKKRVVLGDHIFDYGSTHYLLTSVDLPVVACVTEANEAEPYLGILLRIDLDIVRSLLALDGDEKLGVATPLGIASDTVTPELLDPLLRLCRLEERPAEVDLFAKQVQREVIYRLMVSPLGHRLRSLAATESAANGVARALSWLRLNFRERKSNQSLAGIAGMGISTFHRHFKSITTMTPIQYRKHMQLNEARRLMIEYGMDSASAAYDVGYESPSQFSREYRRLFGKPPLASVADLRRSLKKGTAASAQ